MNYKFEELAQTHPEILFLYVDVDDVQVTILSVFFFKEGNHSPIFGLMTCCLCMYFWNTSHGRIFSELF